MNILKLSHPFKSHSVLQCVRKICTTSHVNVPQSPIGFIGLGNMGGHMAKNLLKKGYPLVVHDVVETSLQELQSSGANIAKTPADVAKQVSCLVTMLPSSPNVKDVYTGNNGLLQSVQKGSLLIDSSTIDPAVSVQMAALAKEKGAQYMDAPVSGGVVAARDGTLTFMVGGPADKFDLAKEVLVNMGKNVVHCGHTGTGQAAKICNNMLLAVSMIGTSETMTLGMKLGLDPKVLFGILSTSTGRCWSADTYNPVPGIIPGVPSSNEYKGGFGTALMAKDLGLAQDACTATKTAAPLGSLAHQIYRIMCHKGYGGKDFSSAYLFLQDQISERDLGDQIEKESSENAKKAV